MSRPTAILQVEVYPIGRPGAVAIRVRDVGEVALTVDEQIRTLRSAIETLEGRPQPEVVEEPLHTPEITPRQWEPHGKSSDLHLDGS